MFFGSIPALVTPFSDGRVAEDTFAELVEWQIAEGSNALVPCGTTGEVPTLTADEHRELVCTLHRGLLEGIVSGVSPPLGLRSFRPFVERNRCRVTAG